MGFSSERRILLRPTTQNLPRRALAAAQRAGDRARLVAVGRLAREEERVLDRPRERRARALPADEHVAVAAARERIGLPVLHAGLHDARHAAEHRAQARERALELRLLRQTGEQ